MATKIMHLSLFMFAMIGCIMSVSSTTIHEVGGSSHGWQVPKDKGFYEDWAKNRTFAVGDELFFSYRSGLNTVVEVEKSDYDHCTSRNTVRTYFDGDTRVTLDKAGDYFFFCSVGKRCEAGQKLHITVA